MLELIEAAKIVLGSVFVLFLPGLSLSFGLFPKKDEIDWIERTALSFGLSIATLPLLVFYMNFLLGINISLVTVTVLDLILIGLGYAIYLKRIHPGKMIVSHTVHNSSHKTNKTSQSSPNSRR
jgi:uncharacterized membrane protein